MDEEIERLSVNVILGGTTYTLRSLTFADALMAHNDVDVRLTDDPERRRLYLTLAMLCRSLVKAGNRTLRPLPEDVPLPGDDVLAERRGILLGLPLPTVHALRAELEQLHNECVRRLRGGATLPPNTRPASPGTPGQPPYNPPPPGGMGS